MTLLPTTKLSRSQTLFLQREYLEQFMREANRFWDNPNILIGVEIFVKFSYRMKSTLASLEHAGGLGTARGKTIISVPERMTLTISRKTLNMSNEDIAKVIRHEVIHIGHLNHGRIFKKYCVEFNASFKGWNLSDNDKSTYKIQHQTEHGKRFKTIGEYDNEPEARKEYQRIFLSLPNGRLRLRVGRAATRADLGGF